MKITALTFSKLLEVSEKSFYRWKSKDHKILVELINTYFDETDIKEWIKDQKISKFDILEKTLNEKYKKIETYLKYFSTTNNELMNMSHYKIVIEYLKTLINYDKEQDFFIQFHNNIYLNNEIENKEKEYFTSTLNKMIKNDIINIINDISDLLVSSDMKILVKVAIEKELDEKVIYESVFQCAMFNIYKYKKNLSEQEKYDLYMKIIKNDDNENKLFKNLFKGSKKVFDYESFEKDLEELKIS